MSKRIFAVILAAVLWVGLMPVSIYAEEGDSSEGSISEKESTEPVTFTASDSGVEVQVTVPSDALPEDAKLSISVGEVKEEGTKAREQNVEAGQESDSFTFSAGEEGETKSGTAVLDISFTANGKEVEPIKPADVVIDASALLEDCEEPVESFEVWHIEETPEGENPVLVAEVSDSDEAAKGLAEFTVDSFSEFEFHYTCSASGWAGFGTNLIDGSGNTISATVSSDYTITSGRYTTTVDMPYTFSIEEFTNVFTTNGTYSFLYATVTDPNYGDEDHEFDVWPNEAQVGANELYGSEENPVVSVTIDGTAAADNPNYGTETVNSKTWHFTLTYADDTSVTIPIYGNADGANDNGGKYCPKYLEINLYYNEAKEAVLNLGNGNGTYSDGDYTGSSGSGGDALRYGTGALDAYADEDGKVTINLPADDNLDKAFTVVDAAGTEGEEGYLRAVTIELGKEQAYDYKLVGWINIATGEYYDVSGGATTAEIDLSDDNVFYADWIAASYDHGSSDDEGLRDDIVSTASFVTLCMFDYNELFNLYSVSLEQNGTKGETWTDSNSLYSEPLLSRDADTLTPLADSFIFQNSGTTRMNGNVLSHANPARWNLWTANAAWADYPDEYNFVLDAEEYWNISKPDSTILGMLYDTEEKSLGVHYVGDADYLFWVDEDGYYTYDSAESGAAYNQSEGRFYVYEDNANAFFPYNEHTAGISSSNGLTDYWFGVTMEVDMYLPSATSAGSEENPVNQVNDQDMVFDFSGDDDIMIFIDDKMVVDMSGIHSASYSRINFSTNTVTYSMGLDETGAPDTTGAGGKYSENSDLNLSAGGHTMRVFYMERGASASNLKIQFNVSPAWEYESGAVQTVTAEKVWKNSDGTEITDTKNMPAVEVGLFDVAYEETDDNPGYTKSGDTYTLQYTDDKNIFHEYVYTVSGSGDTLAYTEGGTTVTYSNTNSDGKVLDDDGLVIAWLEEEKLYIRIDEQTLSSENDWSCVWELLDPEADYEALELSESVSYTTETKSEDLKTYKYWSIIGESEIESAIAAEDPEFAVILTEAAQEASGSIGDTKEAYGWVIVGAADGVTTKQVKFSQVSTLEPVEQANGTTTYFGTYGVTSESEINALGPGAVWYVEDAGSAYDELSLEEFCLFCMLDGGKYYLSLDKDDNTLMLTQDAAYGARFYYDDLGELMVEISDENTVRVEILEDGTISLGQAELAAASDDVRIYTLTGTQTSGFAFTAVNTLLPQLAIEKEVSGSSSTNAYAFQITLQEDGSPYSGSINVEYSDGRTGTLDFTDGAATVTARPGEKVELYLAEGMDWEVVELTEGADSTIIYVDNEVADTASGTITGDTLVRFVNSYRGYFPIDEEIVPDYTDRTTWVKDEAVNEYNAIEIEMSTLLPVITGYELENGAFTMNFHEVLDHELVLDEADTDFLVFIDGNQVSHQYYSVTISPDDDCSFHVDVDLTGLYSDGVITEDDLQGSTEIIIFFFADLEGTGLNGSYKSTVWYQIYDGEELLYTSNVDVVYVYTYEIDILKYDASTLNGTDYGGSALAGATLGVYYDKACTDPVSRNGEAYTVTSDADGKAVFYGLADGTYYVKETIAPDGYVQSGEVLTVVLGEALNDTGYAYEGYFANAPARNISGSKTWDDDNNKADARPDSITVNLYQNGELYESRTVTEADGWTWSWMDLPACDENGQAYAYTINEDEVEYYTPVYYEGNFNITNTFKGEEEEPGSGPDEGGNIPKTSDANNIGVWLILLIAALTCMVVCLRMKKSGSGFLRM